MIGCRNFIKSLASNRCRHSLFLTVLIVVLGVAVLFLNQAVSFADSIIDDSAGHETEAGSEEADEAADGLRGGEAQTESCSGLCWVDNSPASTVFDPKIDVFLKTEYFLTSYVETSTLGIAECEYIWFFLVPIRICARIANACRFNNLDGKWEKPDPGGASCRVFRKVNVPPEKINMHGSHTLVYDRLWNVGDIPPKDNEIVLPGAPRMCAYEDPLDGMDTESDFSPFHENTPREQALNQQAAAESGAITGAAIGSMVMPPGFGTAVGAGLGAAMGSLTNAIMSHYNHVVTKLIGCVPIPIAVFPPPFTDEITVQTPMVTPLILPLPGDRPQSDPEYVKDPSSTFEKPRVRVVFTKLSGESEIRDIEHGDCQRFNNNRNVCARILSSKPNEVCADEIIDGQVVIHGCVPRPDFMPKPVVDKPDNVLHNEKKIKVSLGSNPTQTTELNAIPDLNSPNPLAATCGKLHSVKFCAYIPCLERDSNYQCLREDEGRICVRGYKHNMKVVAKKAVNGVLGDAVEGKPNLFIDGIWQYAPPPVICKEYDENGKCTKTSNPTLDPDSYYYIAGPEYDASNPDRLYDVRLVSDKEIGLCIKLFVTPNEIDNLVLWMDASDTDYIFSDSGCSAKVTSDGQSVACVMDKSGAQQPKGTVRGGTITFETNEQNGKSILRFGSGNEYLQYPYTTERRTEGAYTILVVTRQTGGSGYRALMSRDRNGDDSNYSFNLYLDSKAQIERNNYNSLTTSSVGYNSYKILTAVRDEKSSYNTKIYVNGGLRARGNMPRAKADQHIMIGKRGNSKDSFKGDIGELIMYNIPLDRTQISYIENYLAQKWSIELDNDINENGSYWQRATPPPPPINIPHW